MDNSQKPDKPEGAPSISSPLRKASEDIAEPRLDFPGREKTPIKPAPNSPSSPATTVADDSGEDEVRRGLTNSARPGTVADDDGDDEVPDLPIYNSPTSYLAGDGTDHERQNGSYSRLSYGAPAHNSTDDAAESPLNDYSLASTRASLTEHDRSRMLPIESATTSPIADPATDAGAPPLSASAAPTSPGASSATEEGATNSTTRSPTFDVAPASPETPGYGLGTQAQDFAWTHDYPIRHDGGFDLICTYFDDFHRWGWRQWDQFSFWVVFFLWIYITAHVRDSVRYITAHVRDSVPYITAHVGDSVRYIKAFVTDSILRFFRILAPVPLWYWSSLLLYVAVALGTQIVSRSPGAFEDSLSQFSGQLINPIIGLPTLLLYGIGKLKSNHRDAREYDCCRLPSPPPDCHCPMTEEESYAKVADYLSRVAEESSYAEATEDTSTTTKVEINHSEAMNDMFTMVTDAENDLIREVQKLVDITRPHEGLIADLLRKYRILIEPIGAQKFVSRLFSVREQIQQELYHEAQYNADIFPAEGRIAAVLREFGMLEKSPRERDPDVFLASMQAFVDKLKSYASVVEDSPSAKKGWSMKEAVLNRLRRKGSAFPNKYDAEHATAKALWDLLKIAGIPVKLEEGRYIYLNGHLVTDSTTWDEIFEMMKRGTPVNKSELGQRWGNNYASNLKSQQGRGKSTSKAGEAYPEGQPFVASNTKRTGK
jgi:hypothetical protein